MHQNHLEGLLKFKLLGPSTRVSDSVGLGGGCLVSKLCLTFVTPWTVVHRLLCPWDFPDENTGVGCLFLLQGVYLPDLGFEPRSPALQADSYFTGGYSTRNIPIGVGWGSFHVMMLLLAWRPHLENHCSEVF